MSGCLIPLACLVVDLLARIWPGRGAVWRQRLNTSRQAGIDRAKQRAITNITVERLVAEERLRYLLKEKRGQ